MKKLTYILLAGLTLAAAAACDKQPSPAEEPEVKAGTPMTLTATIGGPQTKLGFTEEDNVLKGTWNAGDQISVISLDSDKCIKTVDTFSVGDEAEGQKKATFTGILSEDATDDLQVLYPALTETDNNGYYRSPVTPTGDRIISQSRVYNSDSGIYKSYLTFNAYAADIGKTSGVLQATNKSFAHLKYSTILEGKVKKVDDGALSVELSPLTAVLKVTMAWPEDIAEDLHEGDITWHGDRSITGVKVSAFTYTIEDLMRKKFDPVNQTWHEIGIMPTYVIQNNANFTSYKSFDYFAGNGINKNSNMVGVCVRKDLNTLTVLRSNINPIVAYIPFVPAPGTVWGPSNKTVLLVEFDSYWGIADHGWPGGKYIFPSEDVTIEPGKMYRIDVDMSAYSIELPDPPKE